MANKPDKRLLTCCSLCKGDFICDVGTDHGYLPCYMVKNGLCKRAYACDIAEKPLESARKHIMEQGLEDKIQTILSDGLEAVPFDRTDPVTDIVIAGMGGEMIASILEKCGNVRDEKVNLVLQPMTKWDVLRKWLYENGFEVTKELACAEGRFVYSVMQCSYLGKKPDYPCDMEYLYFGRVKNDCDQSREYLKRQCLRLEKAGKGLSNVADKKEISQMMISLAEHTLANL